MSGNNPSNEWRIVGGVDVYFSKAGKAVRGMIDNRTVYPYIPTDGGWRLASGELSISALKSRAQRGTVRWA